ncbi:D-aminopeptidase superfamily protein [[Clostridium] ultunense Esp]|nr:D-aminopeptidase superfamily protein [[Clostridium] ultunense Esp]
MKYYVSVDMEGIAGIVIPEQLARDGPFYQEARRLLTEEVNLIVESLLQEGATEIIVKDAHGTGFNFIPDQLHPGASYVMGATRVGARFPGLDSSFSGAFLIGYHSMAGTAYSIRDHTYASNEWQSIKINGMEMGEIGIDSLLFGLHGVPILLVTGDDKACKEAKEILGEGVFTYITKRAFGRHAGILLPPRKVYHELPGIIRESVRGQKLTPMQISPPYEMTVRFLSTDQADRVFIDGKATIRLDGLTVTFKENDLYHMLSHII